MINRNMETYEKYGRKIYRTYIFLLYFSYVLGQGTIIFRTQQSDIIISYTTGRHVMVQKLPA